MVTLNPFLTRVVLIIQLKKYVKKNRNLWNIAIQKKQEKMQFQQKEEEMQRELEAMRAQMLQMLEDKERLQNEKEEERTAKERLRNELEEEHIAKESEKAQKEAERAEKEVEREEKKRLKEEQLRLEQERESQKLKYELKIQEEHEKLKKMEEEQILLKQKVEVRSQLTDETMSMEELRLQAAESFRENEEMKKRLQRSEQMLSTIQLNHPREDSENDLLSPSKSKKREYRRKRSTDASQFLDKKVEMSPRRLESRQRSLSLRNRALQDPFLQACLRNDVGKRETLRLQDRKDIDRIKAKTEHTRNKTKRRQEMTEQKLKQLDALRFDRTTQDLPKYKVKDIDSQIVNMFNDADNHRRVRQKRHRTVPSENLIPKEVHGYNEFNMNRECSDDDEEDGSIKVDVAPIKSEPKQRRSIEFDVAEHQLRQFNLLQGIGRTKSYSSHNEGTCTSPVWSQRRYSHDPVCRRSSVVEVEIVDTCPSPKNPPSNECQRGSNDSLQLQSPRAEGSNDSSLQISTPIKRNSNPIIDAIWMTDDSLDNGNKLSNMSQLPGNSIISELGHSIPLNVPKSLSDHKSIRPEPISIDERFDKESTIYIRRKKENVSPCKKKFNNELKDILNEGGIISPTLDDLKDDNHITDVPEITKSYQLKKNVVQLPVPQISTRQCDVDNSILNQKHVGSDLSIPPYHDNPEITPVSNNKNNISHYSEASQILSFSSISPTSSKIIQSSVSPCNNQINTYCNNYNDSFVTIGRDSDQDDDDDDTNKPIWSAVAIQ